MMIRAMLCGAAVALAGSVASAQDNPAEQTFWDLHAAVTAYERCNDMRFDQAQQTALNAAIMERVGTDIGAGVKLTLVEEAKETTAQRVVTKSCASDTIEAALQLFQTELAAAVGM